MEINGVYYISSKQNTFGECDCWSYDHPDCSARILCNEKYSDPLRLVSFITKNKARAKLSEDGLFSAVVFYRGVLYVFADSSTSQWVLYYTVSGDRFFYSTSLKKLLRESGVDRRMDLTAAKGFLKNGIVLGSRTLVSGVNKLDVCELLTVNGADIRKRRMKYVREKGSPESDLIPSLKSSIQAFSADSKRVFMPLSGGYDSNMILDTLIKGDHSVDAFTVGGKTGKNEIPTVEENIRCYRNVAHHGVQADRSLFSKLPEIIWRLDGYVYERGIFLQYLLAASAAKAGGKTLICGECSDEHQHLLYQSERKRCIRSRISPLETMDWLYQPYTFGNFIVLKKSALMLNSFGILGCYPFATKRFTDIAVRAGKENLDKKLLYIRLLENELPKELYRKLTHSGGSTSIEAVMTASDTEQMRKKISHSPLIRRIEEETEKCFKPFWLDYAELFLYEKGRVNRSTAVGYLKYAAKRVLSRFHLYRERRLPIGESLETDIKRYYLILFSELFLSGEYDSMFGCPVPFE